MPDTVALLLGDTLPVPEVLGVPLKLAPGLRGALAVELREALRLCVLDGEPVPLPVPVAEELLLPVGVPEALGTLLLLPELLPEPLLEPVLLGLAPCVRELVGLPLMLELRLWVLLGVLAPVLVLAQLIARLRR